MRARYITDGALEGTLAHTYAAWRCYGATTETDRG